MVLSLCWVLYVVSTQYCIYWQYGIMTVIATHLFNETINICGKCDNMVHYYNLIVQDIQ